MEVGIEVAGIVCGLRLRSWKSKFFMILENLMKNISNSSTLCRNLRQLQRNPRFHIIFTRLSTALNLLRISMFLVPYKQSTIWKMSGLEAKKVE